ncbi:hypothetical protein [Myceligenerans indicum]|uniref:Uncharacterized protein n=1 Tax=Myceligenerans indicum TaxID=2593663 RepID=A0ABS1LPY3_9MICO|nr:hypothetical protein [Myceligenerans indicum]MBL0888312.1 hypothetical protein [Myceligenerans indicum]
MLDRQAAHDVFGVRVVVLVEEHLTAVEPHGVVTQELFSARRFDIRGAPAQQKHVARRIASRARTLENVPVALIVLIVLHAVERYRLILVDVHEPRRGCRAGMRQPSRSSASEGVQPSADGPILRRRAAGNPRLL